MEQSNLFPPTSPAVEKTVPEWKVGQLAWLLRQPGIGQGRVRVVVNTWASAGEYEADTDRTRLGSWANKLPVAIGEVGCPADVQMVGLFDETYPEPLRTIIDPPPVLWYHGTMPSEWRAAAVVGTRSPDDFGKKVALSAAEAVSAAGGIVVSGLALGCDTVAHEGALDMAGLTVAILGGNLNQPFPLQNRELADRIVEAGGALITEVPPETSTNAGLLISRDRIQSGLSRGTVIAQSGIPSGTLHTAGFTLEQERILIVAEPRGRWAKSEKSAGNLALTDATNDRSSVLPKRFESKFAGRIPLADRIVGRAEELPDLMEELLA